MVFWLAETPHKIHENFCCYFDIEFSPIFLWKIEYYYIIVIMVFWLAETPCGAIKASQNPFWIYAIILIMNFLSYFYKNIVKINNCSNSDLISRDPLRGHQNFTKSISIYEIILIINLYINYFDNEFSLIFFIKRVYQYIILLMVFRTILTYFDLFYLLLPFLT